MLKTILLIITLVSAWCSISVAMEETTNDSEEDTYKHFDYLYEGSSYESSEEDNKKISATKKRKAQDDLKRPEKKRKYELFWKYLGKYKKAREKLYNEIHNILEIDGGFIISKYDREYILEVYAAVISEQKPTIKWLEVIHPLLQVGYFRIFDVIFDLTGLERLAINYEDVSDWPEHYRKGLEKFINANAGLELTIKDFTSKSSGEEFKFILPKVELKRLNFHGSEFNNSDFELLAQYLENNKKLVELEFYYCRLTLEQLDRITKIIRNNTAIAKFGIRYILYRGDESARMMADMLASNPKLRCFSLLSGPNDCLSKRSLKIGELRRFALAMETNKNLLELHGICFKEHQGKELMKKIEAALKRNRFWPEHGNKVLILMQLPSKKQEDEIWFPSEIVRLTLLYLHLSFTSVSDL